MNSDSLEFLKRLLDVPAPSGFEAPAARLWRAEAEQFADAVDVDVSGNSWATVHSDGRPRVMLAGHIDEIGLMVTHVDDDGYLYFDCIGGWDSQVLVGQRVRVITREGTLIGVIGKKPIHLMKNEERDKVSKVRDLWIDIGAKDLEAARKAGVRVGDPAVIDATMVRLGDDLIASRAIDNRIGSFVVLEALRVLADKQPKASVTAVATAQEEIGYSGGGARSSAYHLDPQVAIVVDVTFASDTPSSDKKETGEHKMGGGPVITRGSAANAAVVDRLIEVAEKEDIPYSLTAAPRATATDADGIFLSRGGVATGVISIPNRYMHSPNEIVSLKDVEMTIKLLAAFCRSLSSETSFVLR